MITQPVFTLTDPQNGNLAFKVFSFAGNGHFDHLQRNNYYSLIWVKAGSGTVKADFSQYPFSSNSLFAFSPYQPFMFCEEEEISGTVIHFHPGFFCIHFHQKEVSCNGVLFNNIYQPPFVQVDEQAEGIFEMLIRQMQAEFQSPALAQSESLIAYLKIFLITGSRLKARDIPPAGPKMAAPKSPPSEGTLSQGAPPQGTPPEGPSPRQPFILHNLKEAIETNFKRLHAPVDYAGLLNISAKALAKATKSHFNKTPTQLIAERIVIEAKRELYLTNKPIKEIAFELGYEDEYYFSRFFKKHADISPQIYRDTVGFGKDVA